MREDRLKKLKEAEDDVNKAVENFTRLHCLIALRYLGALGHRFSFLDQEIEKELAKVVP